MKKNLLLLGLFLTFWAGLSANDMPPPCGWPVIQKIYWGVSPASSVRIEWLPSSGGIGASNHFLEYGIGTNPTTWTSVSIGNSGGTYDLTGLQTFTTYKFRIKSYCGSYVFSKNQPIVSTNDTTTVNNLYPSIICAFNVIGKKYTIRWSPVNGAMNYTVRYKDGVFKTLTTSNTEAVISITGGLFSDWSVRSNFYNGSNSNFPMASSTLSTSSTCIIPVPILRVMDNEMDNENENGFHAYPNPTTGQITVKHTADVQKLALYDMTGRQVAQATATDTETTLDLTTLPKGMYFLRADGYPVQKVIKE